MFMMINYLHSVHVLLVSVRTLKDQNQQAQ